MIGIAIILMVASYALLYLAPRAMRRWAGRAGHCRRCDYPMRELASSQCPECGHSLDSDQAPDRVVVCLMAGVRSLAAAMLVLIGGTVVLLLVPRPAPSWSVTMIPISAPFDRLVLSGGQSPDVQMVTRGDVLTTDKEYTDTQNMLEALAGERVTPEIAAEVEAYLDAMQRADWRGRPPETGVPRQFSSRLVRQVDPDGLTRRWFAVAVITLVVIVGITTWRNTVRSAQS